MLRNMESLSRLSISVTIGPNEETKGRIFHNTGCGRERQISHNVINTDCRSKQSSRQDNCPPCHVLRYSSLQFQNKMVHTRLHVTQHGNNEVIQLLKVSQKYVERKTLLF